MARIKTKRVVFITSVNTLTLRIFYGEESGWRTFEESKLISGTWKCEPKPKPVWKCEREEKQTRKKSNVAYVKSIIIKVNL